MFPVRDNNPRRNVCTLAVASPAPASQDKVRIAVMNFENNSQWHWWGDRLGEAAADELVTQLF